MLLRLNILQPPSLALKVSTLFLHSRDSLRRTGAPMLAAFQPGEAHPSVTGFDVWSVVQGEPTVIEELRDGAMGQTVTLVFDGAPTTIRAPSVEIATEAPKRSSV